MKIIIGSDHTGFDLKNRFKELLTNELGYEVSDAGNSADSVDYLTLPGMLHLLSFGGI
jgi:ribose 5-phosphate isomerase RpiB